MKAKMIGFRVLAVHAAVLTGFSLMQGCSTFKRGAPKDDQVVLPPSGAETVTNAGLLGPDSSVIQTPAAAPALAKTYTVQKGDTLAAIASSYGMSWKELADYNHLANPNQLSVGQELSIPDGKSPAAVPAKRTSYPVSSRPVPSVIKQGSTYTIQKGDSLSSIAKRASLTVNELKLANGLKSDAIAAGKKLSIPKKGEAKAAVKAEKPAVKKTEAPKAASPAPAPAAVAPVSLPAPAPLAEAAAPVAAPAVAPVAAPAAPAPASAPVYEHVLYPGETLDDVARQYGSSQQDIMKLNGITDPAVVKPGTKLLVPISE